jgi:MFS family permease
MLMAVFVLYITAQLDLPPAMVGVVFGVSSLAGLVGALLASRAAVRFGTGRTLIGATMISGFGGLIAALGQGHGLAALPWLIGSQLVMLFGVPIYNINQLSLRQSLTPAGIRGRVNATNRVLVWGTMPVGSLLGGFLGQVIGLQPTIAIGAVGMLLAGLWIAASPVRSLRAETIRDLVELS